MKTPPSLWEGPALMLLNKKPHITPMWKQLVTFSSRVPPKAWARAQGSWLWTYTPKQGQMSDFMALSILSIRKDKYILITLHILLMIMCILLMSRYKYHIPYGWKVHLKVDFGSGPTVQVTLLHISIYLLPQLMKTLELSESWLLGHNNYLTSSEV